MTQRPLRRPVTFIPPVKKTYFFYRALLDIFFHKMDALIPLLSFASLHPLLNYQTLLCTGFYDPQFLTASPYL